MGYQTSGVKAVPMSKKEGQAFIPATIESVAAGKYPLARFLYVYVNKQPNRPLAPLEKEFIKMVLSQQGQKIVVKDGYVPLPANIVIKALKSIEE